MKMKEIEKGVKVEERQSEREEERKIERVKEWKRERDRERERRVKVFPSKHLSWKVLIKLFQVMFKILKLWVNHVEYLCNSVFVLYFLQGV